MTDHLPKTKFERGGLPTVVMDTREAAAYLAISDRVLYGMARAGEIPHVRVGRNIRYRVKDLDLYLEERSTRDWEKIDNRGRPPKTGA